MKLLKNIKYEIAIPLTIAINHSMEMGMVPKSLKVAKIIPIYKSKDKLVLSNYRPISLLSSFSKMLEKVLHKRLYRHMLSLFTSKQYGFRKSRSTSHAVIDFVLRTTQALDERETH